MLGELGTKQKILDQEHQKRIEEQKKIKMETITGTIKNQEFDTCTKNEQRTINEIRNK